jgi:hypothetical protein
MRPQSNGSTGGKHHYTGVKSERIERAIADDLAFLAAHPVRQSNRRSAKDQDEAPTPAA